MDLLFKRLLESIYFARTIVRVLLLPEVLLWIYNILQGFQAALYTGQKHL